MVLVVDDEVDMANEISAVLREGGFVAEIAYSGEEALSKLAEKIFDVVLLDIRMPKVSGIEVLKEIRKISPKAEVLMLTALDEAKLAWEASHSGAFDYITKPFKNEELILRINMAIKRSEETDLMGKKFDLLRELTSRAENLGGIYAHRRDLYNALFWKRDWRLDKIDLEEMEAIISGKWDQKSPQDIDPNWTF